MRSHFLLALLMVLSLLSAATLHPVLPGGVGLAEAQIHRGTAISHPSMPRGSMPRGPSGSRLPSRPAGPRMPASIHPSGGVHPMSHTGGVYHPVPFGHTGSIHPGPIHTVPRPNWPGRNVVNGPGSTYRIYSYGNRYSVPYGGWVTNWHRQYPGLNTCYLNPYRFAPYTVVGCRDYWNRWWGPGWYNYPYGFYCNDWFWFGLWFGPMWWPDYALVPMYVWDPICQYQVGELAAPPGGYQSDAQVEVSMLHLMAAPVGNDPSAGLYEGYDGFNAMEPGPRITAEYAYNLLRRGVPVYYHPPGGAFERMNGLEDLRTYLYTPESRQVAPPQNPERGEP